MSRLKSAPLESCNALSEGWISLSFLSLTFAGESWEVASASCKTVGTKDEPSEVVASAHNSIQTVQGARGNLLGRTSFAGLAPSPATAVDFVDNMATHNIVPSSQRILCELEAARPPLWKEHWAFAGPGSAEPTVHPMTSK